MNRRTRTIKIVAIVAAVVVIGGVAGAQVLERIRSEAEREADADQPKFIEKAIGDNEGGYLKLRSQWEAQQHGLPYTTPFDPRPVAVAQLEVQKATQRAEAKTNGASAQSIGSGWTPIGPNPIPNGQVQGTPAGLVAVSGRISAIAVDPTNANIVYVGAAQGGVFRSTDGGTNWTPIFDSAQSLAVGAIAIAPSSPTTVYVGTGEANLSGDAFAGVGLYRIDNATTTANLVGPINPAGVNPTFATTTPFTGRAISKILVSPTDAARIYVSTTSGIGGKAAASPANLSVRGVYRSTNATAAAGSVGFTRFAVAADNYMVTDISLDPSNPIRMVAGVYDSFSSGFGGVYLSTDVTIVTPVFTRTLALPNFIRSAFAATNVGGVPKIFVSHGVSNGEVQRSDDQGSTWSAAVGTVGYCGGQCFYDLPIAVDPTNANVILRGGSSGASNPASLQRATDGATFAASQTGLHADNHAIVFAPSDHNVVYDGNDGGMWRSNDNGATWTSLNNSQLNITQFESIAVHPTDPNFTIGGTQDNGTEWLKPDNMWTRADFGDGGWALIDQNAPDTTNVTMYHTYFNQVNNLMGFGRVTTTANAKDASWDFLGCGGTANGISCSASAVQFYAPMALGPGNPNTVYYGNDRLYRSADSGTTMVAVSQIPIVSGAPITAIGISPQSDAVRVVGLTNGKVFGTSTGANPLVDITGAIPAYTGVAGTNKPIGKVVVDPSNPNVAYVAIGGFFGTGTAHVWKTSNLSNAAPTWVAAGSGLPDAPTNAMVIDPSNPQRLYVGNDVGVYGSTDGGATWLPYGTGLPVISVFDMALAAKGANRTLRIATHGRGMWEIPADFNDTADPIITMSTPTPSQVVTKPFLISGTAADNVAIGSVELAVYRAVAGGQYWNGSSWQAPYVRVPTALTINNGPSTSWSYSFNPPETGGLYNTTAVALDSSLRFAFSTSRNFSVADAVNPAATLTVPTGGTFVPKPVTISGNATDNAAVGGVEVAIYGAGQWWNGTAWQAGYTRVPATAASPGATSTTWAYSFNPPEQAGVYAVNALVYDSSYNYVFTPYTIFGIPDTVNPAGSITTPAPNAFSLPRPVSVTGTATDNIGVGSVQLAIFGNGSQWWNGTTWQAGYTRVTTTLSAPNATSTGFTYSFNPPVGGTFAINATIIDTSGNYIYTAYQYFNTL